MDKKKVCKCTEKEIQSFVVEFAEKLLQDPKRADSFFVKAKIYTPKGRLNIKYR